jgi:hypothetical protein
LLLRNFREASRHGTVHPFEAMTKLKALENSVGKIDQMVSDEHVDLGDE